MKPLPLGLNSINRIQKYLDISESYTFVLKIFVVILDTLINFLISFRMCLNPKLSKYAFVLSLEYRAIQWVPYRNIHQDLLHMPHPLLYQVHYNANKPNKSRLILIIPLYLHINSCFLESSCFRRSFRSMASSNYSISFISIPCSIECNFTDFFH